MNTQPIGIIDSGIGGVSVWKEIASLLPAESTIYLSDAKNLPYGEKSEDDVYALAKRLVHYMVDKQVKLLVIACNTITVSALDRLRADFPDLPIVGTVPVVKSAALHSKNKHIGILSTKRTAESEYQKHLIEQFASDCEVLNLGTNTLVPMVESGVVVHEALKRELRPFIDAHIDALALGCTHFPFLKAEMQQILGEDVAILDSGEAVARQVERIVEKNNIASSKEKGIHVFLSTGEKEMFERQIARLIGSREDDTIQHIDL